MLDFLISKRGCVSDPLLRVPFFELIKILVYVFATQKQKESFLCILQTRYGRVALLRTRLA